MPQGSDPVSDDSTRRWTLPDPAPTVPDRTHLLYGGLGVLLVTVLIRVWAICHTDVIQRDGVGFINYARDLGVNARAAVLARDQHAGYPALLLATHELLLKMGLDSSLSSPQLWSLSGQGVSLVFGTLATMGVWALGGLCLGWRTAWVAAGLFTVGRKWVSLGADVMSDATALALFAWALVCAVLCVRELSARPRRAMGFGALTGVLAGAAYLVRPEGLGAVVVLLAVLAGLVLVRRARLAPSLSVAVITLATAILVASPYMLLIGGITKKKPVTSLVEAIPGPHMHAILATIAPPLLASSAAKHPMLYGPASERTAIGALLGQTAEAVHPILVGLACAYLAICLYHFSLPPGKRRSYLPVPTFPVSWIPIATVALYSLVALRLHITAGYLDWRHCMPIAFVLALCAGGAVVALFDFAACFLAMVLRSARPVPNIIRRHWLWMFPSLLAGVSALSFGPLHGGQDYIRHAADALRSEPNTYLVTNSRQLLFYANTPGTALDTLRVNPAAALEQLAHMSPAPTHLAISERWLDNSDPPLTQLLPPGQYRLVATYRCKGETPDVLRVYRITPATAPVPMGSAER